MAGTSPSRPHGFVTTAHAIALVLLCLLSALLLFQGGFFWQETTWIAVAFGVVLCVVAAIGAIQRKRLRSQLGAGRDRVWAFGWKQMMVPCAFCIVSLLYGISAVVHEVPAKTLLECVPWLLAAAASLAGICLGAPQRRWLLLGIGWIGVASSWVGMVVASGLLPDEGMFHAGRLQFTFQYANAAGAWFACSALLCLQIDDGRLKRLALSPLTALLMTQSMGSILLFAVVAIGCLLVRGRKVARGEGRRRAGIPTDAVSYLLQGVLAVLVFIGFESGAEFSDGIGAVSFIVLSFVFYRLWPKAERRLAKGNESRYAALLLAVLIALVAVCALLMLLYLVGSRVAQASGTFAERLDQAYDAFGLLAGNPLLGVGPDQWQYVYLSMKTADYESTLVHCGYLQVGLDGGVLAMLLVIAVLAFGIAMSAKQHQRCVWPMLLLLALHSLLDFDLMFAFFPVLIGILCAMPANET